MTARSGCGPLLMVGALAVVVIAMVLAAGIKASQHRPDPIHCPTTSTVESR